MKAAIIPEPIIMSGPLRGWRSICAEVSAPTSPPHTQHRREQPQAHCSPVEHLVGEHGQHRLHRESEDWNDERPNQEKGDGSVAPDVAQAAREILAHAPWRLVPDEPVTRQPRVRNRCQRQQPCSDGEDPTCPDGRDHDSGECGRNDLRQGATPHLERNAVSELVLGDEAWNQCMAGWLDEGEQRRHHGHADREVPERDQVRHDQECDHESERRRSTFARDQQLPLVEAIHEDATDGGHDEQD